MKKVPRPDPVHQRGFMRLAPRSRGTIHRTKLCGGGGQKKKKKKTRI